MAGDEPKKALLIFQTITEEIMDSGKAQLYHHAANWLRRVRSAYEVSGGMEQWRKYYAEVSAKHGRKYKLMGLLKPLA